MVGCLEPQIGWRSLGSGNRSATQTTQNAYTEQSADQRHFAWEFQFVFEIRRPAFKPGRAGSGLPVIVAQKS